MDELKPFDEQSTDGQLTMPALCICRCILLFSIGKYAAD